MSLAGEAARLWRLRRVRIAVAVVAFATVTAATYFVAHPRMFTGLKDYDDEGYMLVALKSFINHGSLYDDVFTQYGPFYYEFWGGLFSLFGIPVDHDSGRTVVIVVWMLTGLTVGLATMRITGSLVLGLATQLLTFGALAVFSNEPMHPGGVICLLLAAILALSCFVRERASPYPLAALGGALAALVLVKVNVGFFALASLALLCVVSYPALVSRRWLRPLVEAGFVVLPMLLMLSKFDQVWVRRYAIHAAIAALAVVIVLRTREAGRRPAAELGWIAGGFATVGALVCLIILATGTSPAGLVEGVLVQPLRQSDAFTIPLGLSSGFYLLDLLALCGALGYRYLYGKWEGPPTGTWLIVTSLLSIAVGLAMAPAVAGKTFPFEDGGPIGYPLSMLAFCWVALIAPLPGAHPSVAFARLLLPLLAVLQALHAYPVAGSQALWASFLLIPVGAICVENGVRGLNLALAGNPRRRRNLLVATAAAGTVVMLLIVNVTVRKPLREDDAAYDAAVALALPGAESVRVGQPEAALYREVSAAIRRRCPALLMLPGMNSFYIWAEQEPPTGYNATAWPTLFDDAHQQRVVDETAAIDGLCLLENQRLVLHWSQYGAPPGPLVNYLRRGFVPVASFGEYRLLKRESAVGAKQ